MSKPTWNEALYCHELPSFPANTYNIRNIAVYVVIYSFTFFQSHSIKTYFFVFVLATLNYLRCTFLKAEKLMVFILLNPNVCHCVLEQDTAALPHTNVRDCSVVVGGTVWHRLASMLPSDCPMAAVVYHQRVNTVWMNNGFNVKRFECLEKRPYTSLSNEHHQRLYYGLPLTGCGRLAVRLNTWVRCSPMESLTLLLWLLDRLLLMWWAESFFFFRFKDLPCPNVICGLSPGYCKDLRSNLIIT